MSHHSQVVVTTGSATASSTPRLLSKAEVSIPRLHLKSIRRIDSLLDGAWWPRSTDPAAELPGLILALDRDIGTVERIMLGAAEWHINPRRLIIDGRTVRLGWYNSQPHGLLIATTTTGVRIDLLVVPADYSPGAADQAVAAAVDPANTRRTRDILAESAAAPELNFNELEASIWESEGGHLQRL